MTLRVQREPRHAGGIWADFSESFHCVVVRVRPWALKGCVAAVAQEVRILSQRSAKATDQHAGGIDTVRKAVSELA
jgi:hypothetical protein